MKRGNLLKVIEPNIRDASIYHSQEIQSMTLKKVINKAATKPLLSAIIVFMLTLVIVIAFTGFWEFFRKHIFPNTTWGLYNSNFWENVLVEAHGMLLDILVIGIFILWLDVIGKKQLTIERYKEEIDDFRGLKAQEVAYRIAGNIKRLNKLGITELNLENCYLTKTNLDNCVLTCSSLKGANLDETLFRGANLKKVNFFAAEMNRTNLCGANLEESNLIAVNLENVLIDDSTKIKGAKINDITKAPLGFTKWNEMISSNK